MEPTGVPTPHLDNASLRGFHLRMSGFFAVPPLRHIVFAALCAWICVELKFLRAMHGL
jgi:hypothetical protein